MYCSSCLSSSALCVPYTCAYVLGLFLVHLISFVQKETLEDHELTENISKLQLCCSRLFHHKIGTSL